MTTTWTEPEHRHAHLKIKIKNLADESRTIRKEELKLPGPSEARGRLANHRRVIVRAEARHSQLAYAFLRSKTYAATEKTSKPIDTRKVAKMVARFGQVEAKVPERRMQIVSVGVAEWLAAG